MYGNLGRAVGASIPLLSLFTVGAIRGHRAGGMAVSRAGRGPLAKEGRGCWALADGGGSLWDRLKVRGWSRRLLMVCRPGYRGHVRLAINEAPEDIVTLPKESSCPCELSREPCDQVGGWSRGGTMRQRTSWGKALKIQNDGGTERL